MFSLKSAAMPHAFVPHWLDDCKTRFMQISYWIPATRPRKATRALGIQTVVRGLIAGTAFATVRCPERCAGRFHKRMPHSAEAPRGRQTLDHLPAKTNTTCPWPSLLQPANWFLWVQAMGMDYRVPIHQHPVLASKLKESWLILPELMEGKHVRFATDYAKKHGMRVAGIFYDAIPWLHPEIVLHWTSQDHADYMTAFAGLDVVIPISEQSARDYVSFMRRKRDWCCRRSAGMQPRLANFRPGAGDEAQGSRFRAGENPLRRHAGTAQKP